MKMYRPPLKFQRHLKGWRGGVLSGSVLATCVCLVNIALTVYSSVRTKTGIDQARKVLFQGDCETSRKLNVGLHLLINILGTLLLSASNYGMQCLSAPTRQEIDAAHARRSWLDVGVLSFRNLMWIEKKRVLCWGLLVASSLPLHLFYNSTVYGSVYAVDYLVFMATEAMLESPDPTSFLLGTSDESNPTARYMYASARVNNLTRLENQECMSAYATTFNTARGSLILVVSETPSREFYYQYISNQTIFPPPLILGNEIISYGGVFAPCVTDPFGWICGNLQHVACPDGEFLGQVQVPTHPCSVDSVDPSNWAPFGTTVSHCLSEHIPSRCSVQFVPLLAYVVIAVNFAKAAILLYTFISIKEDPLMTVGDAVASFLTDRDDSTRDMCLMSKNNISWWQGCTDGGADTIQGLCPKPLDTKSKRWSSSVSKSRWIWVLSMYVFVLAGLLALLFTINFYFKILPPSTMLGLGLGAVNPATFIGWTLPTEGSTGVISNALVANIAQPILSSLYYTYNALFTTMMIGVEWNSYARERKGLRVSRVPLGSQRSSYTLQLPKRWALPLMIFSGLLHWLCSQSLFVVSMNFDHSRLWPTGTGANTVDEFVTCGYSLSAVLGAVIVGGVLLSFIVIVGRFKLKSPEMPVAGSCSAAISASCHPSDVGNCLAVSEQIKTSDPFPDGKVGEMEAAPIPIAHQPLKWGALDYEVVLNESRRADTTTSQPFQDLVIGRCSFSDKDVGQPREGLLYA